MLWIVRRVLLSAAVLLILQGGWMSLAAAEQTLTHVYVVYDLPYRYGGQFPVVTALIEHLGHYGLRCEPVSVQQWRAGSLADAEMVVFVGMQDTILPEGLLHEIAGAKQIIWFERNIEQLAKQLQWDNFGYDLAVGDWTNIDYRGHLFYDWMPIVRTAPGAEAHIIAYAKNVQQEYPLVWQRGSVYYSGLLEFGEDFDRLLGYMLHDFFPRHRCNSLPRAILRVEDVSPFVDPQALQAVLATIESYHIPYAIAVVPAGIYGGKQIALHEKPELLAVLRAAQDNGASVIMHGYTHQNEFSPMTGEGYEFWNARDDRPMADEAAFAAGRIEAGLYELLRCGLIPVAFEAPHYAAGKASYEMLAQYFNIYSGEIQVSDETSQITMSLPYSARSDYLDGMLLLPENMGFNDGSPYIVEEMLGKSAALLTMPGAVACFFYHGYLPPDKLGPVIAGMQEQGYTFMNLRELPIQVRAAGVSIVGRDGVISVDIDPQLRQSWQERRGDSFFSEGKIISVQATVLLLILTAFLYIIFRLQRNSKRHYENER